MNIHILVLVLGCVQLVRPQLPASFNPNLVLVYFYYGGNLGTFTVYSLANLTAVLENPRFQATGLPTTCYFHGFAENRNVYATQLVVSAYLLCTKCNLLVFDWGRYADGLDYGTAAKNVPVVGESVAHALIALFDAGLPIAKCHLVGHSMGAQMVGYAGWQIQVISNNTKKMERITGLDPAGPLFVDPLPAIPVAIRHITYTDAKFVDCIHTDAGGIGSPVRCGGADFWPNGGHAPQPCCKADLLAIVGGLACSHQLSWYYWADSLCLRNDTMAFLASPADDWKSFREGRVTSGSPLQQMGISCGPGANGSYFLHTKGFYPFSQGREGATYNPSMNP